MTFIDNPRDPLTGRIITVRKNIVRRNIVRRNFVRRDYINPDCPPGTLPRAFALGLDVGQARDYTAVAILQRVEGQDGSGPHYHLRHLARFELGTSYPDMVAEVAALMHEGILRGATHLIVDRTGVGAPVADMFLHAGLGPIPVNITGGQRPTLRGRTHNVPRHYLISTLQIVLQTGRLGIAPALELAPVLERELINFSARRSSGEDDTLSWRENEHDDLVFALMLAIYYFERIARPLPRVRLSVR